MADQSEKQVVTHSLVEQVPYFPDDKIMLSIEHPTSASVPLFPTREEPIKATELESSVPSPPDYTENDPPAIEKGQLERRLERPERQQERRPFWKRRRVQLLILLAIIVIAAATVVGILLRKKVENSGSETSTVLSSNTSSIASSGVFMNDGTAWNMQVYTQSTTGDLQFQMSPDGGKTFGIVLDVSLKIAPMIKSPLSATAATDASGVLHLNLFYKTAAKAIAMCELTCAAGSSQCITTSNRILNPKIPPDALTGFAAVSISNTQDWRLYYLDSLGFVSELQTNASNFDQGAAIGKGVGLNGSSIAAVNVNSTTNNINIFYVDSGSQQLNYVQFKNGDWTSPLRVSPENITSWDPLSGLGAAYSTGQDDLRVYYTGSDSKVYELVGSDVSTTNTDWEDQPGQNVAWAPADSPGLDITAIGWDGQVRFFQVKLERLTQGSLSNGTWTQRFI